MDALRAFLQMVSPDIWRLDGATQWVILLWVAFESMRVLRGFK